MITSITMMPIKTPKSMAPTTPPARAATTSPDSVAINLHTLVIEYRVGGRWIIIPCLDYLYHYSRSYQISLLIGRELHAYAVCMGSLLELPCSSEELEVVVLVGIATITVMIIIFSIILEV